MILRLFQKMFTLKVLPRNLFFLIFCLLQLELSLSEAQSGLRCPDGFSYKDGSCGVYKRSAFAGGGEFVPLFRLMQSNLDYYYANKESLNRFGSGWETANFPNSSSNGADKLLSGGGISCAPLDRKCLNEAKKAAAAKASEKADTTPVAPKTDSAKTAQKSADNSNPSKSTSGNGSSESKSDSTTAGSSGGNCYPSNSEQVPGLAMCDSGGKPSCWMSEDQYQDGLPQCDAYGKPQESSTADNNGATDNSTTDSQNRVANGDANLPVGFPLPPEVESDREYCESSHKSANVCCNDPVQCITGLSGPTSSTVSAVGSLLMGATSMMALNGTANSQDAAGVAKSCNLMKMVAMGGTIANTALGAKCLSEKSSCEDKCQEIEDKYRKVLAQCTDLDTTWKSNGGNGPRCPETWKQEYITAQSNAAGRGKRCTGYNSNVAAMGNQAAQSAAASGFADLCSKAASAQATGFPNIDQQPVFSGDCNDPANASNPICVNCRGTAALTDPLCKGLAPSSNTSSGTSSAFQSPDFGTRAINGSDINVPDTNGQVQDPLFGNGLGTEAKSNSVPSNGGSFTGGSGGGGMPFSGGGGGGYGGGPGYDTDILKGLGGGGGYSASPVPTDSRGGYSGGGQASTKRSDNPFDKFDLKKYLPGNNKSGANRGPAGTDTYRRNPEIGGPHEDLFEKIHRRYRIMCKQGRFIGCGPGGS